MKLTEQLDTMQTTRQQYEDSVKVCLREYTVRVNSLVLGW